MNHLIKNFSATALLFCMFTQVFPSAMAATFFVDKGHTDVVDGIPFEIVPPHLFIKKAFKLRGENLTSAQLLLIREAMPSIANMTHKVLTRPINKSFPSAEIAGETLETNKPEALDGARLPRSIYQLQHIESPTQLFIQTLKNWQVTESSIQFSSDYFYRSDRGPAIYFRDTYLFTKTNGSWRFLQHPNSMPEGVLQCAQSAVGWKRCDVGVQQ
jgi:hypothetical protein